MQNYNGKRVLIAVVVTLLFIIGVVVLLFSNRGFRIISISPDGTLPTSITTIKIEFSESLDKNSFTADSIILNPAYEKDISIDDKTMTIELSSQLEDGSRLEIMMNNIASVKGETLSQKLSYNVAYVPFNKLPVDVQNEMVSESAISGDNHPLLSVLPYDGLTFKVTAQINPSYGSKETWQEERNNYSVFIQTYTIVDGLSPQESLAKHQSLRKSALEWIKEQGIEDPEKELPIYYTPNDDQLLGIEEEFPGE